MQCWNKAPWLADQSHPTILTNQRALFQPGTLLKNVFISTSGPVLNVFDCLRTYLQNYSLFSVTCEWAIQGVKIFYSVSIQDSQILTGFASPFLGGRMLPTTYLHCKLEKQILEEI